MGTVGRFLGGVLGPRGNKPRQVPPTLEPSALASGLKDTASVRSRDRVTFHTALGSREQGIDDLASNAVAIWDRVTGKLERGAGNIRSCFVKTSMGPSIRVEVIL